MKASALTFAILATPALSFFRVPCPSRLVTERIDPIISPGKVSGHVHTVSGAGNFNFTTTYEDLRSSTCSTCPIKEDLSAYWTPKLYFHAQNGSFIEVPQAGDGDTSEGGMTVYYLQRPGPDNDPLRAFPEGFRMVAGNPFKRNYTGDFAAQAISFNCLNYAGPANPETNDLPNMNCPDGVRAQVFFPSCWDGVNLDSDDHKSHMSYPAEGAYNTGTCPSTHPVHVVSLFFEVIYQTNNFADMWYSDSQPFVFAQGDPTGYGFHGDFINGWDVDVLQNAVDNCLADSGVMEECQYFTFFDTSESMSCKIPEQVEENVGPVLDKLPGCNPVQPGPADAVNYEGDCSQVPPIESPGTVESKYYTDLTSKGWRYVGCGVDSVNDRTFTGANEAKSTEVPATCVDFCSSQGYSYAGLEYSTQCYCSNDLPASKAPPSGYAGAVGQCTMPCGGDSKQYCGGPNALSIYQKCGSGSCVNLDGSAGSPNQNSTLLARSYKRTSSVRHRLGHVHGKAHRYKLL